MRIVRGNTAQGIILGPFVGEDGLTLQNGLTIAQANVRISKNFAAFAAKNNAVTASLAENGQYTIPFNDVDLPYGHLRVAINMSGCCPYWEDFFCLEESVFDALKGTGYLPADVQAIESVDPTDYYAATVIAGFNLPVTVTLDGGVEVTSFSVDAMATMQASITPGTRTTILAIEETRA